MRSGKRHNKRRKKWIIKNSKGFFGTRKNFRLARKAMLKSIKNKKISYKLQLRTYRRENISFLNTVLQNYNINYNQFMHKNKLTLKLNTKILVDIYKKNKIFFEKILNYINNNNQ